MTKTKEQIMTRIYAMRFIMKWPCDMTLLAKFNEDELKQILNNVRKIYYSPNNGVFKL